MTSSLSSITTSNESSNNSNLNDSISVQSVSIDTSKKNPSLAGKENSQNTIIDCEVQIERVEAPKVRSLLEHATMKHVKISEESITPLKRVNKKMKKAPPPNPGDLTRLISIA